MSNFETAIRVLRESRGLMSATEEQKHWPEIESAIRILEKAAKADKGLCVATFARIYPVEYSSFPMIYEILLALPDAEENQ